MFFYTLKFCVIVVVIMNIINKGYSDILPTDNPDLISIAGSQRDDGLTKKNEQKKNREETERKPYMPKSYEPLQMKQYMALPPKFEYYDDVLYVDLEALTKHNTWVLKHKREVFTWQHNTGYVIFIFVLLLVVSGVVFSAMQFIAQNKQPSSESKLKIDKNGIEVSSSVIGIIILAISLGFFYLYLHFVYTIH